MMTTALGALRDLVRTACELERINCHHNFAAIEHHHGRSGYVVRKGAIRARVGDRGVIPGSMGAESYIVTGLGNLASYQSCSHGAGRELSRSQAKHELSANSLEVLMEGKTWQAEHAEALVDEHPLAYKDIGEVMAAQTDLVRVDHKLTQVLNYKGTK
jgi:tRNA-splicing ligase RtcB